MTGDSRRSIQCIRRVSDSNLSDYRGLVHITPASNSGDNGFDAQTDILLFFVVFLGSSK
jgi:hypothetical protein